MDKSVFFQLFYEPGQQSGYAWFGDIFDSGFMFHPTILYKNDDAGWRIGVIAADSWDAYYNIPTIEVIQVSKEEAGQIIANDLLRRYD
jgi:hypothetical protein